MLSSEREDGPEAGGRVVPMQRQILRGEPGGDRQDGDDPHHLGQGGRACWNLATPVYAKAGMPRYLP